MIVIHYEPTRYTPTGAIEAAWCEVDGARYAADSATGAIHALCRVLRDAGIPDQNWTVPGRMFGPSTHKMADWSVDREGRIQKFRPMPVFGEGKSGGYGQPGDAPGAEQTMPPLW